MELDKYYTPADVCAVIFGSLTQNHRRLRIADFACGNGGLLETSPYRTKSVFGLDIDPNAINQLKARHPDWSLVSGDFINPDPQTKVSLDAIRNKIDLVLLNPPFSYRGGTKWTCRIDEQTFRCSKAMAFLVQSLDYLAKDGSLMAIMPLSILRSERDQSIMEKIKNDWDIRIVSRHDRTAFVGCRSCSVSLVIKSKDKNLTLHEGNLRTNNVCKMRLEHVSVLRGCVPMFKTKTMGLIPVLHTKNLPSRPDNTICQFVDSGSRTSSGLVVAVPRVGNPDLRKVCTYFSTSIIVPSDCIYLLQADTETKTKELHKTIVRNWEHLELLFASTCAPYLTIKQLVGFLNRIGYSPEMVSCIAPSDHTIKSRL